MSDDLKRDLANLLTVAGVKGDIGWLVDQIIDRCLYGAAEMGAKAREEIDRLTERNTVLTSELAAAKMLVSGKVTDALVALVEENERLYEALEDAIEHDKIVAFHRREGGAQ